MILTAPSQVKTEEVISKKQAAPKTEWMEKLIILKSMFHIMLLRTKATRAVILVAQEL